MINKVKPFHIRITDDMTPQIVQDAFDKCVDAGAVGFEGVQQTERKNNYAHCYSSDFYYLGVNDENCTFLSHKQKSFGESTKEITLDQLDEWLGLDIEQEWKNGDSCIFGSSDMSGVYITYDKYNSGHVIYSCGEYFYVLDGDFQKPETPEQKAERERLEAIKEMAQTPNPCGFAIYDICEQLYDAGYRKQ